MDVLRLRVVCRDLPGARFCDEAGNVRDPVHLGIQSRREVIDDVRADASEVVFEPEFTIGKRPEGSPNFLGPFAQGTPADRFFYLSWGVKKPSGAFEMFRRLKIRLGHLTWPDINRSMRTGKPITVQLRLTDCKGGPLCGSARSPDLEWR